LPEPSARPVLVLVGRPNVGKSSLFNRIAGGARAVVDPTPGVTRDHLEAQAEWTGRAFTIVDTAGLGPVAPDPLGEEIRLDAERTLEAADVVLFVVDAAEGLVPEDRAIADRLRRLGRPVVVVANKADRAGASPAEFYALGFGEPHAVSAVRGEGVGDVLDEALARWGGPPSAPSGEGAAEAPARVAFVGRPNVGKSSLVNRLLGADRLLVSEVAGTTRDAVDVPWEAGGHRFVLVDTPGLRRPSRVETALEEASAQRSRRAIARADVAVLVLEAPLLGTEQDKRIGGLAVDRGVGLVVAVNKADLVPRGERARLEAVVRERLPFLEHAPVLLCSARTGEGVSRLVPLLAEVARGYRQRLPTPEVNACLQEALAAHPPAAVGGSPVRIYYAAQVRAAPPTLVLLTNRRQAVGPDYARYLERRLRERFGLRGVPVRLVFRVRPHRPVEGGRRTPRARS
jgi:GTP-binding protein